MSTTLQETLARISHKCVVLTQRYEALAAERDAALAREQELRHALANSQKALEQAQQQIEYLRLSSVIAPDSGSVQQMRDIIADLVHDIDRCLADLKE